MNPAKHTKDLFFNNGVLKFKHGFSGQQCNELGQFVLGDRAGPECCLTNLIHEVSHFIELPTSRLEEYPNQWNFSLGEFWQIGTEWGYDPKTTQQVEREARTWSIQLSIQREIGLSDDALELVRCAVYLPAWWIYKSRGKNRNPSTDTQALLRLARRVERMSKSRFDFEQAINDFKLRIRHLEDLPTIQEGCSNDLDIPRNTCWR